jgi:hypothetical protein
MLGASVRYKLVKYKGFIITDDLHPQLTKCISENVFPSMLMRMYRAIKKKCRKPTECWDRSIGAISMTKLCLGTLQ